MQFNEIQLSGEMLKAIDQIGYTDMTEIQEKSIPVILSGREKRQMPCHSEREEVNSYEETFLP